MPRRWSLSAKISLFATLFLVLSLASTGATLWMSWKLEGGAAAVNEAGRLRMLSYRTALDAATGQRSRVLDDVAVMQASVELLRRGDPARPLFMPWDDALLARYDRVQASWNLLRTRWLDGRGGAVTAPAVDGFVAQVDALVTGVEHRLDFWSTLLHTAQLAIAGLIVIGTIAMFLAAYLLVLDPVGRLARGVAALTRGDLGARVDVRSSDELGELAQGFNAMARQLQGVHDELEQRVRSKTADLRTEQQRLAALYEISALVARAPTLEALAERFTRAVQRIAGADAAVLRWTDETAQRYLLLASEGMPAGLTENERCLRSGSCYCGQANADEGVQMLHFHKPGARALPHDEVAECARAGFHTLLSVPVATQLRLLGELDLFYRDEQQPDEARHALLEALAGHLAAAMESLRGAALEREAAVAQERTLIARELHDSIAQSLAALKIQLQLLRSALRGGTPQRVELALEALDTGVRESLADVRELLLHFRTRTQAEDIEPALRSTLHKFELQSGVEVQLQFEGHGQPLDPDVQVQVLHILQEALSNVRKHARAGRVQVQVGSVPSWRFEIADDGQGFEPGLARADAAAHVGRQIMGERAAAIGAQLRIESSPGRGTRVVLELAARRAAPDDSADPALAA